MRMPIFAKPYLDLGGLLQLFLISLPNWLYLSRPSRMTSWIAVRKVRCEWPKSAAFHLVSLRLLITYSPILVAYENCIVTMTLHHSQRTWTTTRSSLTIFTCVVVLCEWPARVASLMSLIHLFRFARHSITVFL